MLDPEDAHEALLRVGVLASSILEQSHDLCVDVIALKDPTTAIKIKRGADDLAALAAAMVVLARR